MRKNIIDAAIEKLGGLTQATVKTGVAHTTWTRWRQQGYITDAHVLLETAALTGIDAKLLAKPTRRSATA